MPALTLDEDELREVTGGYVRPSDQLRFLLSRGFFRATIHRGRVLLERSHYDAVRNRVPTEPAAPMTAEEYERAREPSARPAYRGSALESYHVARRAKTEADKAARSAWADEHADELRADAELRRADAKAERAALVLFHANKRRAEKLKRTPPWADMDAIKALYQQARATTMATGVEHHVDHVIPLQGRLVSGLHVHTNMQIIPGSENSRKRNRFEPC